MPYLRRFYKSLASVIVCLMASYAHSDTLTQAIDIDLATTDAAIHSQKKIDEISDQTQKMLEEYRAATRNTETLKTYNDYLRGMLNAQLEEKASLQQQMEP